MVTRHGRPNSLAKVMVLFEVGFATQYVISIISFLCFVVANKTIFETKHIT